MEHSKTFVNYKLLQYIYFLLISNSQDIFNEHTHTYKDNQAIKIHMHEEYTQHIYKNISHPQ